MKSTDGLTSTIFDFLFRKSRQRCYLYILRRFCSYPFSGAFERSGTNAYVAYQAIERQSTAYFRILMDLSAEYLNTTMQKSSTADWEISYSSRLKSRKISMISLSMITRFPQNTKKFPYFHYTFKVPEQELETTYWFSAKTLTAANPF
jgi:hypothetical protein